MEGNALEETGVFDSSIDDFSYTVHPPQKYYLPLKRVMDIVGALAIMVFFFIPAILIALAIWATDRGSIFYRSVRVKEHGRHFIMLKFRSMRVDADKIKKKLMENNERDGILFKMENDPRVTSIGRFLRRYSIDEVPQVWNVLCGDMSLVGPRPPLQSEVNKYTDIEYERLSVPQGMTGLWQVQARDHSSFRRYIRWDLFYVRNRSIVLDLRILYRTVAAVFRGTGV